MVKRLTRGSSVGWLIGFQHSHGIGVMWGKLCPTRRQAWREASDGDPKELLCMKEDGYKAVKVKIVPI